jgi:hypothetical protein
MVKKCLLCGPYQQQDGQIKYLWQTGQSKILKHNAFQINFDSEPSSMKRFRS